jgi:hypothetical protein
MRSLVNNNRLYIGARLSNPFMFMFRWKPRKTLYSFEVSFLAS